MGSTDRLGLLQTRVLEEDACAALSQANCSPYFEGKRVVITGATGMLGGWVTYLLARMKAFTGYGPTEVLILRSAGNRVNSPIWDGLIPDRQVALWDPQNRDQGIPEADIYFHLASPASARDFLRDPVMTMDLNTRGTSALLNCASRVKGARLLFVSSSEIYGITPGQLKESTVGMVPLDSPRWLYAESKRLGELLCRVFGELGSVDTVVVRPFHTFGPGMRLDDSRVFGDFIAAIMRGKELIVRSGPTTNRTFCYAPEAAVGFLMATAGGANGDVFNIAGQAPTSIGALAEILTLEFLPAGSTVKYLNPTDSHRETNPVHEHSPDTSRIRALGWVSPTDALGAFRRTIEYLRRIEIGPLQSPLNE